MTRWSRDTINAALGTVREGDRIRLLRMPKDPCPIEPGTTGTVRRIQGPIRLSSADQPFYQLSVDWDTERGLTLVVPPDEFVVIERLRPPEPMGSRGTDEWIGRDS